MPLLVVSRNSSTRWSTRVSFPLNLGCYVTKFAPHKALKLIAWFKLTFDEMVMVSRVKGPQCGFMERIQQHLADFRETLFQKP